jgi:uncharacterized Zn finger protein (UPF0148 family)
MATFSNEPGFCPKCGTILPLLGSEGDVICYNCKQTFGPEGKEARISWQYFTMLTNPRNFIVQETQKSDIQETNLFIAK